MEFEAVIGLEVHCQLATNTKIFCGCPARPPEGKSVADLAPNVNTCPVCTGQPGSLPVLNAKALEYAVRAGVATGCTINLANVFARKNYFYPDLPKGYQISQYERPICEHGALSIEVEGQSARSIPITRIHMEEDAGKSTHHSGYSLVNLNRAGTPLIEIVSGPDMKTAQEAGAYLRALHALVTFLGISDGNMQEGNFRCDANVSVMSKGSMKLGTRAEIKNVNSFRFVEKAIEFEIARQSELIRSGGKVIQETRTYDAEKNATFSMRSKEEAEDYRYFPDPDLVPIRLESTWVEEIRRTLPELPEQKRARFITEYGLSSYDAGMVTGSRSFSVFFEEALTELAAKQMEPKAVAKQAANLISGEITRLMKDSSLELDQAHLKASHLADVVKFLLDGTVSSTGAKQVLSVAWRTGEAAAVIVEREGLKQVSDLSALEPAIAQVIATSPNQVAEFKAGKEKILGYFVGQVMKATGGKANPALLQELIRKKLSG